MAPFYGWGSTASRLEPLRGGSLLLPLSPQKFLVLTLSTLAGWKAESVKITYCLSKLLDVCQNCLLSVKIACCCQNCLLLVKIACCLSKLLAVCQNCLLSIKIACCLSKLLAVCQNCLLFVKITCCLSK